MILWNESEINLSPLILLYTYKILQFPFQVQVVYSTELHSVCCSSSILIWFKHENA